MGILMENSIYVYYLFCDPTLVISLSCGLLQQLDRTLEMFLLWIVHTRQIVSACLMLWGLHEEIKENYIWSLNQFKRCLGFSPKVISTDRELALMSAIVTVFPESKNILFVWHIEKNIYLIAKNTSPPKKHGQSLFDHGQVV